MNAPLNTIIIDDDIIATKQLKEELSKYPMLNICGNVCSGEDGRNMLLDVNPDLIFLDVELPDCLGFDFLHSVKPLLKDECHVIFFTAYNKYMIKALREKAFDYLLKPIDTRELSIVIGRVLEEGNIKKQKSPSEKNNVPVILNTAKGDVLVINSDDISFFSYDEKSRYWIAFLSNGEKYALKRATKSEKLLSFSNVFEMTDKSHIINIQSLSAIKDGLCIMKTPFDAIRDITISKTKLQQLKKNYPSI
jgi:two-component SAPR family response regulator